MVSKSYIVSKYYSNSVERKETCDDSNFKIQNSDHVMKKNFKLKELGFVIRMNELKKEMVKMKPSKNNNNIIFCDDNSSSSSPPRSSSTSSKRYWNQLTTIEWNRKYINETVNRINKKLLLKIIAACIAIMLICFIVSSLTSSSPSTTTTTINAMGEYNNINNTDEFKRQRLLIKPIINDSIIDTSEASTTTKNIISSKTTTEVTAASSSQTNINNNNHHINNIKINDNLHSSVLPPFSAVNVITTNTQSQNHGGKKSSDDAVSFTKNYVERINFFTTSNKNLFSVKVSPTLPSINRNFKSTTTEIPVQNYANDCESTALPLCQGILSYDLTDSKQKWNLTNVEYQHFQHLIDSNCSNRVHEYVCNMLEPECRPSKMKNLMPCRRICKGIFESCSYIIASSEVLTEFFDCNRYIDSNDVNVCEDITRARKNCFDDEFQCADLSCISLKWRCDNIRDCANGEDEDDCKFCNYDEFKCLSDQKCISEKWQCDGFNDCSDGSDETNCDSVESDDDVDDDEEDENVRIFYDDIKDYNDHSSIDHNDSDGDKIISTGDIVMPIFINPNSTSNDTEASSSYNSSAKLSNRFRSTMRKTSLMPETTTTTPKKLFEETSTSTSITKSVTSHSTSHLSPCPDDHLRCIDGLCITLDQICDKIRDCSDNSDELHCEY